MIPELGHFILLLALGVALVQGAVPLAGAQRGRHDWMALARPTAYLQFVLVALSFICLTASFVRHDFSVLYVASNSNSALPVPYRIAAVWGGHEGSLLLWVLMLNVWTVAVARFSRSLPQVFVARILARAGTARGWISAVHADHVKPFRALASRRGGRARPESAVAGPGHGDSPSDALHGLCRVLGRLCIRDRGIDRRQP